MVEAKGFHAQDGAGISIARIAGIKTGLITRRNSETVALAPAISGSEQVHQGIRDKLKVFREILRKEGLTASEVAFVGDDVIDLPVMRNCGFSVAVANARREVKAEAHYVTPHAGGDGALRDVIEFILKAQGKWKQAVEKYIRKTAISIGTWQLAEAYPPVGLKQNVALEGQRCSIWPNCQVLKPRAARCKSYPAGQRKTHRSSAWGVLGSTTDGLPFLLTHPVVFRSN